MNKWAYPLEENNIITNDRIWAFKQKLEFGKMCVLYIECDSFPVLQIFLMKFFDIVKLNVPTFGKSV